MPVPEGMSTAELRHLFSLYNAGQLTLDEINQVIGRKSGKPYADRSGVYYLGERMGLLRVRNVYHEDLIPWKVKTEHNGHEIRRWLGAEARRRAGKPSAVDPSLLKRLSNALDYGTYVVTYSPEMSFRLVPRKDTDRDIIRAPATLTELRGSIRRKLREDGHDSVVTLALAIGLTPDLLREAGREQAAAALQDLLNLG